MNREQLQKYTRKGQNHGLNTQYILQKFMQYQKIVKDPLLVFRYMEEKAICIFLPQFWLQKGKIHAELGDYVVAFECIVLARSRTEDNDAQSNKVIDQCEKKIRTEMINDIRITSTPSKQKRSLTQHGSYLMDESFVSKGSNQSEMLKIYQEKYGKCKQQKQKQALSKRKQFPFCWMHDQYEKEDALQTKIQQKIHQNSNKLQRHVRYHSMHTPMAKRDPMRLKNTKNSVELARIKKQTREKNKMNRLEDFYDSQNQPMIEDDGYSMNVNSLPVGKKFEKKKSRTVTFSNEILVKKQKLRSVEMERSSFQKILPEKEDKMDIESQGTEKPAKIG